MKKYIGIIVLTSISCAILLLLHLFSKIPYLTFQSLFALIVFITILLLPVTLFTLYRKFLKKIIVFFICFTFLIQIFYSLAAIFLEPPVKTFTKNIDNYNEVELPDIFPEQVPASAKNIDFKYQIYYVLDEKDVDYFCMWKLDKNDYEKEKQRVSELIKDRYNDNFHVKTIKSKKDSFIETIIINDISNHLIFFYSDELNTLAYTFCFIKGEHQPYFKKIFY